MEISKETIEDAVKQNDTVAGVLKHLGYNVSGGRYSWIKRLINKYDIDTSHFVGQGWKRNSISYLTNDMFAEGSTKARRDVRDVVIRKNLIPYRCSFCGNEGIWNGKTIALQLDHINGISNDNRLENLRFLCPNCHATTETYCGKNIKSKHERKHNYCKICGAEIHPTSTVCVSCNAKTNRKVSDRPEPYDLAGLIVTYGFRGVGNMYGVSDQAIHKWCKSYDIPSTKTGIENWYKENQK